MGNNGLVKIQSSGKIWPRGENLRQTVQEANQLALRMLSAPVLYKKQKEEARTMEQIKSKHESNSKWVPCEKIEKLTEENKVIFLAFLDGLKESQAEQELWCGSQA